MTYKLTVKFDTDNASFQDDNYEHEVNRLLGVVTTQIKRNSTQGILRDSNGNKIGSWDVKHN